MRTAILFSLVAGSCATAAPGKDKDPPKPPPLVGEWAVDGMVVDGTPKRLPAGTTWTFTADGRVTLRVGRAAAADEGTYTADMKKDPAEVDIHFAPRTWPAVYRRDGDKLTICQTIGDTRPTGFDAPAGSNAALWTLTRVRPKD